MRKGWLLVLLAGCTIEAGKDVPPVVGGSGVAVDADQKVSLDTDKVPVLASCGNGQYVRRSGATWECANIDFAARDARLTSLELADDALETADETLGSRAGSLDQPRQKRSSGAVLRRVSSRSRKLGTARCPDFRLSFVMGSSVVRSSGESQAASPRWLYCRP